MIATAAFILGSAYESAHLGDDYDPDGVDVLLMLVIFMVFDLWMATVIA